MDLKVQPEVFRCPEVTGQPEGRIGGDRSRASDDLIDATWRDARVLREPILADGERTQEFLLEDLAGMNRGCLWRGMSAPAQ